MSKDKIDTHGVRINFGTHKGELFTRIPVSYLRWMVREETQEWKTAEAELDRRGTCVPDVEASGHAIDTASLRCRRTWLQSRSHDGEGLHAWLCRMGKEALDKGVKDGKGRYLYNGIKLVIVDDIKYPVIKTVMIDKKAEKSND